MDCRRLRLCWCKNHQELIAVPEPLLGWYSMAMNTSGDRCPTRCESGERNERLPLNGADVLIKGRVEDDGVKLVRRRKQELSLSARPRWAIGCCRGPGTQSGRRGFRPFRLVDQTHSETVRSDCERAGFDPRSSQCRPRISPPIGSFEEDINGPQSKRRLMLNATEFGKHRQKDHFPLRRDVILGDLIEALHPVMRGFRRCERCISIKTALDYPPCEKRHGSLIAPSKLRKTGEVPL